MPDRQALYNPIVYIEDVPIKFEPNSLTYNDGFGEYKKRARAGGGGAVDTVFSKDITTAIGKVKFNVYPTKDSAELIRLWKSLADNITITITDSDESGDLLISRTFKFAALVNDPTVNIGSDTTVELNFESDPAA